MRWARAGIRARRRRGGLRAGRCGVRLACRCRRGARCVTRGVPRRARHRRLTRPCRGPSRGWQQSRQRERLGPGASLSVRSSARQSGHAHRRPGPCSAWLWAVVSCAVVGFEPSRGFVVMIVEGELPAGFQRVGIADSLLLCLLRERERELISIVRKYCLRYPPARRPPVEGREELLLILGGRARAGKHRGHDV